MKSYPDSKFLKYILLVVILISVTLCLDASSSRIINKSDFNNVTLLNTVFDKLYSLEKNKTGKVNIVHIGDSHIQADFFTNTIRHNLQAKFGNGGYGFTFPYTMAKTNGTDFIKYTSNVEWESKRNIYPVTDVSIGLSGIGLYTDDSDFRINLTAIPEYAFSVVKLLYPTSKPQFKIDLGGRNIMEVSQVEKEKLSTQTISTSRSERQKNTHTVLPKETLYKLSIEYKIPVEDLKKANNLKSNTIKVGDKIIIPINKIEIINRTNQKQQSVDTLPDEKSILLASQKNSIIPYCSTFSFLKSLNEVSIVPDEDIAKYNLNGIVLENNRAGLIYHSIGVNGTKFSDYNKYPLFFEQLPNLNPDLLIISLGTNESFGKWTTTNYINQMQLFINKVKQKNPNTIILLMTPPPSLFKRKNPNTLVADYSDAIREVKNCVIWNLFEKLGGTDAPNQISLSPLMAKDRVHYTRDGYKMQGELFSSEFLSAYDNYIKSKTN